MSPQLPMGKEAQDFVTACESIHALLAREPLTPNDREVIIQSAHALLNELRLA